MNDDYDTPPACTPDPETGRCSVCGDTGEEGKVVALGGDGLARVVIGDEVREIAIELVDAVRVGDRVLVHAGVALARVES